MSKVLIGVPCMETLPVEYVNCILQMKKPPGAEIMHDPMSLVYIARERICSYALQNKFDYVLFIDSDMVFPPDVLPRLLAHDKDIVSGMAFQRKPPYAPCFYEILKLGEPGETTAVPFKQYPRGLIEVQGVGMGCTLIKTEVLQAVYDGGNPCFEPMRGYGEDLTFCLRARHLGYKIYTDTNLQIGHIGRMICTEETYKQWNEVGE